MWSSPHHENSWNSLMWNKLLSNCSFFYESCHLFHDAGNCKTSFNILGLATSVRFTRWAWPGDQPASLTICVVVRCSIFQCKWLLYRDHWERRCAARPSLSAISAAPPKYSNYCRSTFNEKERERYLKGTHDQALLCREEFCLLPANNHSLAWSLFRQSTS